MTVEWGTSLSLWCRSGSYLSVWCGSGSKKLFVTHATLYSSLHTERSNSRQALFSEIFFNKLFSNPVQPTWECGSWSPRIPSSRTWSCCSSGARTCRRSPPLSSGTWTPERTPRPTGRSSVCRPPRNWMGKVGETLSVLFPHLLGRGHVISRIRMDQPDLECGSGTRSNEIDRNLQINLISSLLWRPLYLRSNVFWSITWHKVYRYFPYKNFSEGKFWPGSVWLPGSRISN